MMKVHESGAAEERPLERVLVVEDDADTRRTFVDALRDDGYEVIAAVDGRHALRLASATDPSAIVLDLSLPEMTGDEFMRRWRKVAERRHEDPSLVVVTGAPDAQRVGAKLRAQAVLRKPIGVRTLLSAVHRAAAHAA